MDSLEVRCISAAWCLEVLFCTIALHFVLMGHGPIVVFTIFASFVFGVGIAFHWLCAMWLSHLPRRFAVITVGLTALALALLWRVHLVAMVIGFAVAVIGILDYVYSHYHQLAAARVETTKDCIVDA